MRSNNGSKTVIIAVACILSIGICPVLARQVDVITVDGPITPVVAKYINEAISRAESAGDELLVIRLDTPGGLLQSTMSIDKRILASRVPVAVYISPSGGRAASAGVFITYAAHFAAMAPSTNIGSAHPVTMGGKDTSRVMLEKVTNDAVAHIKGLARQRQRNARWAEEAVRSSINITEQEALKLGVINLVARNLDDLMEKLQGRTVEAAGQQVTLQTAGAELTFHPMGFHYQVLNKIADPNIAYLLMMAGIIGIFFELRNPGAIFPGVLGGISLILAFFAFQVLPINAAGILLILLAVIFFIMEVHITSYGLLTIGGLVAMILGSLMLYRSPELQVSLSVMIPAIGGFALFILFALYMALKARLTKSTTGVAGMVGERGSVVRPLNPEGQVSVHGEIWRATSQTKVKAGTEIEVVDVKGMLLIVKPVETDN